MTQRKRSSVEFWRLGARGLFISGPERELARVVGHDAVLTAYRARFRAFHVAIMICESEPALDQLVVRLTQSGHGASPDQLAVAIDRETALALAAWLHRTVRQMDRQGGSSGLAVLIERVAKPHLLGSAGITLHRIAGRPLLAGMISGQVPLAPADPATVLWPDGDSLVSIKASHVWPSGAKGHGRTCLVIDAAVDLPQQVDLLAVSAEGFVRLKVCVAEHDDIEAFRARTGRTGGEMLATLAACDDEWRAMTEQHLDRQTGDPGLASSRHGLQLYVDAFVAMPHGVYLAGRVIDPDGMIATIDCLDATLVSSDVKAVMRGRRVLIATGSETQPGTRLHAFLPRKDKAPLRHVVELAIRLVDGGEAMLVLSTASRTLKGMRTTIVDSLVSSKLDEATFTSVIRPALEPVHARIAARIHVHADESLGPASRRTVSIIVPLYRETGFIIRQLLAFAADPVLREEAEIIFCVDDPAIENAVRIILTGWGKIWPLDVKLVVLSENAGYGLANNLAVSVATAPVLVLMNSDVVPERPGWLAPMLAEMAALPAFSVLGPKLLYADGTLQHAGMSFLKLPTGIWQNVHPGKGLGRDDRIAATNRDVPAVTGALMVLRRDDFLAVGGFSADYVSGDYEDSDLCLKLRAKGGRCRYVAAAELYHFERQSIGDADVDHGTTIHNRLLQHVRWDATIRALAQHHPEIGDA